MKRNEAREKLREMAGMKEENPEIEQFLFWNEKFQCYSVDIDKVANYLVSKNVFKTIYGKKDEVVWIYKNGIYTSNGTAYIKVAIESLLEKYSKNNLVNEVLGKIKRMTQVDKKDFENTDLNRIPFINGVYNLKTKQLEEHSPDNNFRFIIPINYDSTADCLLFKQFVEDTFYPEEINTIQEFIGSMLYRKYFIKKAGILLGETNTGKTTLINILINFIGEKNKTGIALQKLTSGNDFAKLSLKDRHLNCFDDLSFKDLQDEGAFKVAVGGGFISAEEKFGDNIEFKNFAKMLFATNQIPPAKNNHDLAYYIRWIVFRLDNPVIDGDPFLSDKIKEENPGILNWALIGLERALNNNKFSYNKTAEEIKEIMEYNGNPLVAFGIDVLKEEKDSGIPKEEMYNLYSLWATIMKKPRLSKEQLGRQLPKWILYTSAKGGDIRYWDNVAVNPKFEQQIRQMVPESKLQDTIDTLFLYTSNISIYNRDTIDMYKKNASEVSRDKNQAELFTEPIDRTKLGEPNTL